MGLEFVSTRDARNWRRKQGQAYWERVRNAQASYSAALHRVARQVDQLIRHYTPITPQAIAEIQDILNRYAHIIRPWASSTASMMIAEVARRDATAWKKHAKDIGGSLQFEIRQAPINSTIRRIHSEQVEMITSLPIEAAAEVQRLALNAYTEGTRYEYYISEIEKQLEISDRIKFKSQQQLHNRATLIARTETSKAASAITQARAEYLKAPYYKWRTAKDADVRPAHRRLEGTLQRWDDPPEAEENGTKHHPGEFPNCRCYAEPQIDEIL